MSKYKKEDILRIIKEEKVSFINLQFTDIMGTLKSVCLTVSQLEKALDNKCMFDGSSIDGFVRIEESDMQLHPDLDSFVILPWDCESGKTARLICDVYNSDGTPFEGDPRYVLRRAIKKASDMGFDCYVGPECEFFLFHLDEHGKPTTKSYDMGGYFDLGPVDRGEGCRKEICLCLEQMGFEIEASHHENAMAQHEIDFKYDEVLHTADNVMTFKYVVKNLANRHGLYATFMPKPIYGICGSGMHINLSLFKDGKNVFCDENDNAGLSQIAYNFIAGVMHHIKAITILTNPIVNSYKRLVPGYEAPVTLPGLLKTEVLSSVSLQQEAPAQELSFVIPTLRQIPILQWRQCFRQVLTVLRRLCFLHRLRILISLTLLPKREEPKVFTPFPKLSVKLPRNLLQAILQRKLWALTYIKNISRQSRRSG